MHDAIELEKMRLPTAVICIEPFISSPEAMSRLGGIPGYLFVVISHTLGNLAPDVLRERARQAAPEVLRLLLARG